MTEITLYDLKGTAVAYVADDETTVHLWKGKAVAYLVDDKIYSWRGRHLGWFTGGVVYDGRGRRVGSVEWPGEGEPPADPSKPKPSAKTPKAPRAGALARPTLSTARSALALGAFLQT